MTSSSRHLKPGQPRWNHTIQRYKDSRDVFCETGLFSIIVLACGRPELTKKTVLGTLQNTKLFAGETEWIFIENGNSEENYEFFKSLELERKVIVRQANFGINQGLNQGWALSRGEFVMVLENDWWTNVSIDFLSIAKKIFMLEPDIDIIQMRDPRDPSSNFGLGKPLYNPLTAEPAACKRAGVAINQKQTGSGHIYFTMGPFYAFNNNPIILRKSLYREFGSYPEPEVGTDNRFGETFYQEKIYANRKLAAYIGMPLYRHLGQIQTKAI